MDTGFQLNGRDGGVYSAFFNGLRRHIEKIRFFHAILAYSGLTKSFLACYRGRVV